MSVRFKKFLHRVGRECEFKPLKNALLNYLNEESERKYKNYPKLLNRLKRLWPKYSDRSRISHLLRDHYDSIFTFWLNTIFPFRKTGLTLEDPEAPTPVDFKLVYKYQYNQAEITAVEEVLKELELNAPTDGILKRILIFSVSAFAPLVEQIFERPFAFQFSNIDSRELEGGGFEVIAIISAREQ